MNSECFGQCQYCRKSIIISHIKVGLIINTKHICLYNDVRYRWKEKSRQWMDDEGGREIKANRQRRWHRDKCNVQQFVRLSVRDWVEAILNIRLWVESIYNARKMFFSNKSVGFFIGFAFFLLLFFFVSFAVFYEIAYYYHVRHTTIIVV